MSEQFEKKLEPLKYIESKEFEAESRIDGRLLKRKSVGGDKTTGTSDIADDSITTAMIQALAVTTAKLAAAAVTQAKLSYETVNVTVNAGASTGTATVTSGSIVLGWYATGNQDQFIDNISIAGTTLTITLAANATANNTFTVILLKS